MTRWRYTLTGWDAIPDPARSDMRDPDDVYAAGWESVADFERAAGCSPSRLAVSPPGDRLPGESLCRCGDVMEPDRTLCELCRGMDPYEEDEP